VDTGGIEHGIIARVVRSAANQSMPSVTPQRQSLQAGLLPPMSQVAEAAVLHLASTKSRPPKNP
jgi:hypothetical protein